jgi:hypothetical protein
LDLDHSSSSEFRLVWRPGRRCSLQALAIAMMVVPPSSLTSAVDVSVKGRNRSGIFSGFSLGGSPRVGLPGVRAEIHIDGDLAVFDTLASVTDTFDPHLTLVTP